MRDAIREALLECGVDVGALAGFEAIVVGEELDVENAEAVELGEDEGGGVGGWAEAVVGMGGHPLLEVAVGCGEVEIVEGVVAVVEWGAGEWGAEREEMRGEKQDKHKHNEGRARGWTNQGRVPRGWFEAWAASFPFYLMPEVGRAISGAGEWNPWLNSRSREAVSSFYGTKGTFLSGGR